ncbi:hypothetical protein GN956_G4975 [Arapaima gigas]
MSLWITGQQWIVVQPKASPTKPYTVCSGHSPRSFGPANVFEVGKQKDLLFPWPFKSKKVEAYRGEGCCTARNMNSTVPLLTGTATGAQASTARRRRQNNKQFAACEGDLTGRPRTGRRSAGSLLCSRYSRLVDRNVDL